MRLILTAAICFILASHLAANDFYDEATLNTLELSFSQSDWWLQLTNNYRTKTNIAAELKVNGITYDSVGVRFRGNTSYQQTNNSQKKSFNIEIDWKKDQSLTGYKTLNLINCLSDPTFMREVTYSNICRQVFPSAKAIFVKLVINGQN